MTAGDDRLDGVVEAVEMRIDRLKTPKHRQRPFVLVEILQKRGKLLHRQEMARLDAQHGRTAPQG